MHGTRIALSWAICSNEATSFTMLLESGNKYSELKINCDKVAEPLFEAAVRTFSLFQDSSADTVVLPFCSRIETIADKLVFWWSSWFPGKLAVKLDQPCWRNVGVAKFSPSTQF
jgi:hypothetical protein